MGTGHGHGQSPAVEISPSHRRLLMWILIPFMVLTGVGMVLLWPHGRLPHIEGSKSYAGVLLEVHDCPTSTDTSTTDATPGPTGDTVSCVLGTVRLSNGPNKGETAVMSVPSGAGAPKFRVGDKVVVSYRASADDPESAYALIDFQRGGSLVVLAVLFGAAVVALSRWRGVAALAGLGISVLVLLEFMLPALLAGHSPLLVAVVAASAIMICALYLAHGVNVSTSVALLGTLMSLALTAVLGTIFLDAGRFTGFADESASWLSGVAGGVDLRGLILAGLVVGSLGVLDDITVTQTSAIWELAHADPSASRRRLFSAGMRIGKDHVSSTVNTLVLAYAGAALPLLLLFQMSESRIGDVLTGESIATEIVRSLVGGLGIVAAVPVTTAIAAWTAGHGRDERDEDLVAVPAGGSPAEGLLDDRSPGRRAGGNRARNGRSGRYGRHGPR